ncbi:hypothetical protein ACFQZ4_02390 [Catellatospora coxensis]|uniref:Uncharacterized protein n=1 Tax=Catellatospora coxensis TaxID=310354 RepID=A0A8J3PA28_9ACTN|nr:hypothetical protein [Catellatospora coxensis]GIG09407.1 hypothetical protein Cco03nite_61070 [Catellatospora coxensis]
MGIEEKISNLTRRYAGRSMELVGKISHNTRWQLAGYTIWLTACDDAAREKAKDQAKAMEAVSAYLPAFPSGPQPFGASVASLDTADLGRPLTSPKIDAWPDVQGVPDGPAGR